MLEPIKLTVPEQPKDITESFSLSMLPFQEKSTGTVPDIFTEAVFADGRKTLDPIIQQFQAIKDVLDAEIKEVSKDKRFNPQKFWKHKSWLDLEKVVLKTFGFRDCQVFPFRESYNKSKDEFSTKMLNCYTFIPGNLRFPIEGIVSDKGFYDNSHTLRTEIYVTLGLIRDLTAEEITAVLIHEIGHNIDPALVDINYVKTNVLSKYLTDRKGKISSSEKSALKKGFDITGEIIFAGLIILFYGIVFLVEILRKLLFDPTKAVQKIRSLVSTQKDFDRKSNIEAFADNFARMYGLGAVLMKGLQKISRSNQKQFSRIKNEKRRQQAIADLAQMALKDVHKTEVHRIHNLIKESKADLKDPNIPAKVKKDIEADLKELELVLDKYLNSFDKFQNTINQVILEELKKIDANLELKKKSK